MTPGMMSGNLFAAMRVLRYMPYIAIGILVAAIAIWVVFGIKKFRWARNLAIVLTILVVITGILSFLPSMIGIGSGRGQFDGERPQFEEWQEEAPQDRGQFNDGPPQDRQQLNDASDLNTDMNFYEGIQAGKELLAA